MQPCLAYKVHWLDILDPLQGVLHDADVVIYFVTNGQLAGCTSIQELRELSEVRHELANFCNTGYSLRT